MQRLVGLSEEDEEEEATLCSSFFTTVVLTFSILGASLSLAIAEAPLVRSGEPRCSCFCRPRQLAR